MCRFAASSALRHEVALAGLQAALKTGHGPVPPVLQPVDLDAHFPATAPPEIRLAAAAAPRPRFRPTLQRCHGARGPASPAAPSAGTPVALRAPSVPADAFTCTLLDRTISPTPWTLDSPLISVQENWGRFTSPLTGRCANRETPSIGANGVDDLRLWASEPSGRAGTGDAHHHRVEHSQATGRDAYRLDKLIRHFPLRGASKPSPLNR